MASRRGSWTVTAVNGTVAGVVLLMVAFLALVVNPPAPPGIAAFAPQASKPITKALPGQSSVSGEGEGQCAEGQVCATPTPTTSASAQASASAAPSPTALRGALPPGLQCYEWPNGAVTQTFDPQSPPCVARWDDAKGNGGATSPGVTGKEIKVALPVTTANSNWPTLKPIVDFFNTRFQLYGRTITIVPVPSKQADGNTSGSWNDPVMQKADAAAVKQANVFATLDFLDPIHSSGTLPVFLDAMARAKIVSINGGETTPYATAKDLESRQPYTWSYYPTIDVLMRNIATMTCRQLAGRPATHAPDPALKTKTRKFAVWLPGDERLGGPMPGLGSLTAILDGCGVHDVKVVRKPTGQTYIAAMNAAMQQLKNDGVTSVLFYPFGGNGQPGAELVAAQQVGYRPEWVTIGWNNYNTAFMLHDPQAETAGAFGVGMWNKHAGVGLEAWNQALNSAGAPTEANTASAGRSFYQEMLLLASGIQMAGPDLTPASFARGLHETEFPNPGAGGAPSYQASVGFPGNDPFMVSDFTAFWLDNRTSGQQVQTTPGLNTSKAFCAVGLGRRWDLDSWPTSDGYYQGGCR